MHVRQAHVCAFETSGHWSMCEMVQEIQLTLMNFLQLLKLT